MSKALANLSKKIKVMFQKDLLETSDIKERILQDFGSNTEDALKAIRAGIIKYDYLNHPRIIRCIIYLANKDLETLAKSINDAIGDPRDVMLWAEYTNIEQKAEHIKRVRNFNKTFQDCEKNVQE